ncbi:acyl dehydratase [Arthrobacter sp. CAN_A6]|uniref:MaoC family dehydratase n=1 Tax=Arthrobacter sp. CAN_A6 TaxID=2787721 RepID=UPI0018CBC5D9
MTGDAVTPGLVPLPDRFFDDYVPGAVGVFGAEPVSEAEILDFAARFDPQGIHTDASAAAGGPFNGLIASGWHTMALMMRILVRYYLNEAASLASPGVDELRWLKPVRPGDVLSLRCTVVQARASRSKPDRGLVHTAIEILDQNQETVATLTMMNLLRRRPDPAPAVSGR